MPTGGEGVAAVLIVLGLGTLAYAGDTLRRVTHQGRRVSLTAALVPTVGWVWFYASVLFELLDVAALRTLSRWLVVALFATVNLQSWAMRRTENGGT